MLKAYRVGSNASAARRAHVVLLRAADWSWNRIRDVLFCSNDLIAETMCRFAGGGVRAVLGQCVEERSTPRWLVQAVEWLNNFSPRDFGYFRTRWSCEILSNLLAWNLGVRLSAETIRRGLRRLGYVWRRPRPIVGLTDPQYERKLREIRSLLTSLPGNELAVLWPARWFEKRGRFW